MSAADPSPPLDEVPPVTVYDGEPAAQAVNGNEPATLGAPVRRAHVAESATSLAAEQSVLGALLLGAPWAEVAGVVRAEDFTPVHRLIIAAIANLATDGKPHDPVTAAQQLESTGHLAAAGGIAYLSELARNTPTAAYIRTYAVAHRERAIKARIHDRPRDDEGIEQLQRDLAELQALKAPTPGPAITLRHIADIVAERREAQWLGGLRKILERYVLAVLAGSRNTFKSFIAHHWAMLAAVSGEPVIILSAEGAGLDRRTDAWMRTHAPAADLRQLPLLALERAVNLNAQGTLDALRQAIDAQSVTPALMVVDTYSKYAPGLDENDNAEVALYLATLSTGLRAHYGCTVLLVAHAGHGDVKRPRGASVLMANPDAEYIVERPDASAMTATATRERFKDCAALPPLAYCAEVVDLGRLDSHGEAVTSLVMRDADLPAALAARRPELRGGAQRQLLAALRAQGTDGAGIWTLADIREIGRKAGLAKGSARSAAEALTFTPHLTATVGGWRLSDAQG